MNGSNLMLFTALQRFLDRGGAYILNSALYLFYKPAALGITITWTHEFEWNSMVAIYSSVLLWPHVGPWVSTVYLIFVFALNSYYPQDVLFLCGMIIFFLYRFLTTLPTSWRSIICAWYH
ncbi:hypothetical protein BJV74DRAFT_841478 [Russula compacta]|nr:hypothetical protein BJV74DRAFT_841478 [Russula compacta]